MGAFKGSIITKKGQELLAKVVYGSTKLEFTQIKTSENVLSGDLASRTNIGTIKQAEKVASIAKQNEHNVKVSASFSNMKLTAGYYVRNIGLYAMDPTEGEILYSISVADESNSTADWMPPFNGAGVSSLMVDLVTAVSTASSVDIEVDPTAIATVAQIIEVKEHLTALDNSITTTTEKTLKGSVEGVVKLNKVLGKSEQITTNGKQLLAYPYSETTVTKNGITFTDNGDGTITVSGTAKEGAIFKLYWGELVDGSYYVSGIPSGSKCSITVLGNESQVYDHGSGVQVTDGYQYVYITVPAGTTVNGEVIKPMINTGTAPLPYEPYTGGIASPNPNYPQEIKSVEISEITVCGKNLIQNFENRSTINGITFTVNEDGSITANGTATDRVNYTLATNSNLLVRNGTYILSGCNGGSQNTYRLQWWTKDVSFYCYDGDTVCTFEQEGSSYNITIAIMSGVTVSNLTFYPMLRDANILNNIYEPYKENTITLSQPVTLNGIGEVTDELTPSGVVNRIGCVDLGTLTWKAHTNALEGTYYAYVTGMRAPLRHTERNFGFVCSHYRASGEVSVTSMDDNSMLRHQDGVYYVRNANYTDVTALTSALAGVMLYYELDEVTVELLPVADQIALRSLLAYDGVTCLNTNSETEPIVEVEYGTNKMGAHTLTGLLTAQRNELKLAELTSKV